MGSGRAPGAALSLLTACILCSCAGDGDEPEDPRLQNPLLLASQFTETAPETFQARLETTAGVFVIEVHRDWAPLGADRWSFPSWIASSGRPSRNPAPPFVPRRARIDPT